MTRFIMLISLALLPSISQACPIGMDPVNLPFGVQACQDSSGVTVIKGSLTNCPGAMVLSADSYGNKVCRDGAMVAYDIKSGCPQPFTSGWSQHNRPICIGLDGVAVASLVDSLR